MVSNIDFKNVIGFIRDLNDIQLVFYIDEFTRLSRCVDVKESVFYNDINTFLNLALYEVVERFRQRVEE